jgi:uridylate kinase
LLKDIKKSNPINTLMPNKTDLKYKRILFKVSGEAMMGDKGFGHDVDAIQRICNQIISAYELGCEICLVVGGGNIFRGISVAATGMERASADYMGMLATCINGLALQNALEKRGVQTRMQSAIRMDSICEPYIKRKADRHLEKGRIVIFAAGTGNPFFTTDTAAVLRAVEVKCDVILKGTQVDGVYSADPKIDKNAVRYEKMKYNDVIKQELKVMDQTAITLAKDNKLPIIVFSIKGENALCDVLQGKGKFTIIN